jgi:hypothetical protein
MRSVHALSVRPDAGQSVVVMGAESEENGASETAEGARQCREAGLGAPAQAGTEGGLHHLLHRMCKRVGTAALGPSRHTMGLPQHAEHVTHICAYHITAHTHM